MRQKKHDIVYGWYSFFGYLNGTHLTTSCQNLGPGCPRVILYRKGLSIMSMPYIIKGVRGWGLSCSLLFSLFPLQLLVVPWPGTWFHFSSPLFFRFQSFHNSQSLIPLPFNSYFVIFELVLVRQAKKTITMFAKICASSLLLVLALCLQVTAHAAVAPVLGVQGNPKRSDVQRPSAAKPCGNVDIASKFDSSTPVSADANGSFKVSATSFNGWGSLFFTFNQKSIKVLTLDFVVVKMVPWNLRLRLIPLELVKNRHSSIWTYLLTVTMWVSTILAIYIGCLTFLWFYMLGSSKSWDATHHSSTPFWDKLQE